MRIWQDRIVQFARRFTQQNNGDGTITLTPSPGTVSQAGTPVNAALLNAIENDIVVAATYSEDTGNPNAYTVNIPNLTALIPGQKVRFRAKTSNTGAATLNVNGLGDVPIKANLFKVSKITGNFVDKVAGSNVENPNKSMLSAATALQYPNQFTNEVSEWGTTYSSIASSGNGQCSLGTSVSGGMPQQLFSFNVIEMYERKYGLIPVSRVGTSANIKARQVAWLRNNVSKITCRWTGYGKGPSGNKANLTVYLPDTNNYATPPQTHSASTHTSLSWTWSTSAYRIPDNDGIVNFAVYTDPASASVRSDIFTDVATLDVEFKETSNLEPQSILAGSMVEVIWDGTNFQMVSPVNEERFKAYSVYRINKDSEGVFTEVQTKRLDGTLYKKSVLSGGTSPKYTTQTVTYYATDGVTAFTPITYALSYDSDDDWVNEEVTS